MSSLPNTAYLSLATLGDPILNPTLHPGAKDRPIHFIYYVAAALRTHPETGLTKTEIVNLINERHKGRIDQCGGPEATPDERLLAAARTIAFILSRSPAFLNRKHRRWTLVPDAPLVLPYRSKHRHASVGDGFGSVEQSSMDSWQTQTAHTQTDSTPVLPRTPSVLLPPGLSCSQTRAEGGVAPPHPGEASPLNFSRTSEDDAGPIDLDEDVVMSASPSEPYSGAQHDVLGPTASSSESRSTPSAASGLVLNRALTWPSISTDTGAGDLFEDMDFAEALSYWACLNGNCKVCLTAALAA